MAWLLAGNPAPVWPMVGSAVAVLVVMAGFVASRRARRMEGSVSGVFWRDVATVATVLAGVVAVPALAALVPVEGIGEPLWMVIGLAAVATTAVLFGLRWRSQGLGAAARRRPVTPTAAPPRRLVSTGWEIGMALGGVAGLLTYVVSADHAFGHPIHWVVAVLGMLIGYVLGIGLVTPRFSVERHVRRGRG